MGATPTGTHLPTVSIVAPVFNGADVLAEFMDSLLAQVFTDFEVICIDDGSTDESAVMLQQYAQRDPRIRVLTQTNQGQAAARNAGLDLATGTYVALLDSDDVFDESFLSKLVARAEEREADIVVCRCTSFDHTSRAETHMPWTIKRHLLPANQDPFSWRDAPDGIIAAFQGWAWDKLFRRDFVQTHRLRFPSLANSEDLGFVYAAMARANRISVVDEVLVSHREGRGASVSASRRRDPALFYRAICLLKDDLRRDMAHYEQISWGFLNWAFDYTLWNIRTMDDPVARGELVATLVRGGFDEIELTRHARDFFTLYPDDYWLYARLLREATGYRLETHPMLHYPQRLIGIAQKDGWLAAGASIVSLASRHLPRRLPQSCRALVHPQPPRAGASLHPPLPRT